MPAAEQLYDLMLLIRPDVDDDRREQLLQTARQLIEEGGGRVEGEHDWGLRPMTFEIGENAESEYYLFQFTAPPSGLEEIGRTLRITDGILRYRIIKVLPGTPPPPEVRTEPVPAEY